MNRKNALLLVLIFAGTLAAPATIVKATEAKLEPRYKVISAPVIPIKGFTTNQLKPYILSDKEVQAVLGNYSDEIEKLKSKTGYYVFDKEKYGINDSNVYVMISLGQRNTTGYGLQVNSVEDIEGISKITIHEIKPAPDAMVGEAITYPYMILRFAQGTPNVKVVTDSGEELPSLVNTSELEERGWNDLKPWWDVSEDKEWLITFKKSITAVAINDETVYVRDSSGRKVATQLIKGEDKKTVRVVPVEKYIPGETYYLFISDKMNTKKEATVISTGYRMQFTIKSEISVEEPVKQEANCYVVSSEFENVPLYDAVTDKHAGTVFKDFSVNLTDVRDDKAYFTVQVADDLLADNTIQKQYYIPVKYLEKTYKEPFIIPMIISIDKIKVKENATLYAINDGVKQPAMKTGQAIGPMHFIMKTSNGYEFTLANNIVFLQPEDVELIKN